MHKRKKRKKRGERSKKKSFSLSFIIRFIHGVQANCREKNDDEKKNERKYI